MTPLAKLIVEQAQLPHEQRKIVDDFNVIERIFDVPCWDITEIRDVAFIIYDTTLCSSHWSSFWEHPFATILPEKRVWIEHVSEDSPGQRDGYLLEETPEGIDVTFVLHVPCDEHLSCYRKEVLPKDAPFGFKGADLSVVRAFVLLLNTARCGAEARG